MTWNTSIKKLIKINGTWIDPVAVQSIQHDAYDDTAVIILGGGLPVDVPLKDGQGLDDFVYELFREVDQ